jgi:hypothetical protein
VLLLAWFAAAGAFTQFFAQAVGFNLHYIALQAKPPVRTIAKIAGETSRMNATELILLPFALAGIARTAPRPPASLAVAGAIYFAMTFVSFQAWPDTILFGAPLAALLAAGIGGLLAAFVRERYAWGIALAIALAAACTPSAARLTPPLTFAEQRTAMRALAAGIADTDSVIAVSIPEFLIHTGRISRWPWPYLWFGVDRFCRRPHAGRLRRDPGRSRSRSARAHLAGATLVGAATTALLTVGGAALRPHGGADLSAHRPADRRLSAQNSSLSLRTAAKISTGSSLSPGTRRFTEVRSSALSVRRNGLVAFSSPIVDGTVGWPAWRWRTTSARRRASSALPGSSVAANPDSFGCTRVRSTPACRWANAASFASEPII